MNPNECLKLSDAEFSKRLNSKISLTKNERDIYLDFLTQSFSKGQFGRSFKPFLMWIMSQDVETVISRQILSTLISNVMSKYLSKKTQNFINEIVNFQNIQLREVWIIKLKSVVCYSKIWEKVLEEEIEHTSSMSDRQFLKSVLANAERCFTIKSNTIEIGLKFSGKPFTSKEQIASGASLMIRRYGARFLNTGKALSQPIKNYNEKRVVRFYEFLLSLEKLIDFGVKIGRLGFECYEENGEFKMVPRDRILNMSLQYGYLRTDQSQMNRINFKGTEQIVFSDLIKKFLKEFENDFVKIAEDGGVRRIRLEIPKPMMEKISEEFLLPRKFYHDEALLVENACIELHCSVDNLIDFEVAEGLSIIDAFIVVRIFKFFAYIRDPKLMELEKTDESAFINSLLILFHSEKQFIDNLVDYGFDSKKAHAFYKFYCAQSSMDNESFDLQYQPLLQSNKYIILFANILSHSNIFRNALIKSKKRLVNLPDKMKIESMVEKAVLRKTPHCKVDVKYKFNGIEGDFDVIFSIGSQTFVFECKDMMLPCNSFEQRSYFEQIEKGIGQCRKAHLLLQEKSFREYVSKKIGWDIEGHVFHFAVVPGPRLLSGSEIDKIPIRSLKEIISFIEEGVTVAGAGPDKFERIPLWENKDFSTNDLIQYLSTESKLYKSVWNNVNEHTMNLSFNTVSVSYIDYGFDMLAQLRELGASESVINDIINASKKNFELVRLGGHSD